MYDCGKLKVPQDESKIAAKRACCYLVVRPLSTRAPMTRRVESLLRVMDVGFLSAEDEIRFFVVCVCPSAVVGTRDSRENER